MNICSVFRTLATALIVAITLPGCTTGQSVLPNQQTTEEPRYDGPPKVVYRIDDHRFISLEKYSRCDGDTYYSNTRLGIRHKLGRGGIVSYSGRLIIDDPTEMNVVIPSAPDGVCGGSRGCSASLVYSTDGGNTFHGMYYMEGSQLPPKDSERYTIAVTTDGFYVVEQLQYDARVSKFPLVKGINLSEPYPPGVHDVGFLASKRPGFLGGVRTPSGQDRFVCDIWAPDGAQCCHAPSF